MCWSAEVSLNTFLFSGFFCALAYINKVLDLPSMLFGYSFIGMQLVEYFLWKGYDNYIVSVIGFILVLTQPVFSIFQILNQPHLIQGFLLAYMAYLALLFTYKPISKIDFSSVVAPNGHFRWNWANYPLWLILPFIVFSGISYYINQQWLGLLGYTLIITVVLFTYFRDGTWGSMWCWAGNLIAFYWIYKIVKKNQLLCIKPS